MASERHHQTGGVSDKGRSHLCCYLKDENGKKTNCIKEQRCKSTQLAPESINCYYRARDGGRQGTATDIIKK